MLGREEDRQPAVGDLADELRVLRPDRRDVDRDPLLHRRDHQLERLARPVGERQRVGARPRRRAARARAPCARSPRTRACARAACRSAGRASPRPPAGRSVPRPSRKRPFERWSSVTAVIAVIAGERPGHLEDRRAELDALGLGGEPGQRGGGVGAVGLGGPDRVEAGRLGLEQRARADPRRSGRVPSSRASGPAACKSPFAACASRAARRILRRPPMRRRRPARDLRTAGRLPAAAHARGDARGDRGQPHHRGRLHRPPGRRLPDAGRPPQRRAHQPGQLRPRLGPLHGRAAASRARPATASSPRCGRCSRRASRSRRPRAGGVRGLARATLPAGERHRAASCATSPAGPGCARSGASTSTSARWRSSDLAVARPDELDLGHDAVARGA